MYPSNESYGWHLQYLTIIGLSAATLTFATALLADILLSRTLFRIKNIIGVTAAPLEAVVTILYWGLRSIDTRLVLPEWAPPLAIHDDLSFHFVPALALAIDLLFLSPPWTISFVPAAGLSAVMAGAYWVWVERCYKYNGFYPYPIFDKLETGPRAALFAASGVTFLVSLAALKRVQAYLAPQERPGDVRGDGNAPPKRSATGAMKPDERYQT